jgi:hypothetical protein
MFVGGLVVGLKDVLNIGKLGSVFLVRFVISQQVPSLVFVESMLILIIQLSILKDFEIMLKYASIIFLHQGEPTFCKNLHPSRIFLHRGDDLLQKFTPIANFFTPGGHKGMLKTLDEKLKALIVYKNLHLGRPSAKIYT